MKQQSEEQGQQLEGKLKQLAAEIDLKMREKSEEPIRRLESRLQEQLDETKSQMRQLADDVASMKELLMKLASK